ncbi:MaoC/PaaZ C-terminal domain-containing protein [Nitratireductor alexandrii]|uniref:MaoC/PaaZ C-terminal domain-containing protein n=1 Tax=Nitratireductor alexandrii TaxID=2448161 RepID=UPI000FD81EFA|nr:MaoC/PaaZ C-terminal domain-containing protein [Nitratireductor alexandrii]
MIDEAELRAFSFGEIQFEVTPRDAILYGLGVGLGNDPTDTNQLRYVYESALEAFPTMPVVLGSPGMWFAKAGLDWRKIVHGAQSLTNYRPVPIGVPLVAASRVAAIYDRGAERGAVVEVDRNIATADGTPVATTVSTYICRGDGGFGGTVPEPVDDWAAPDRAPDAVVTLPTLPQQALIYRLSGDINPLHADPAAAAKAGFDRPILHGLCTYGLMARGVLDSFGGRLAEISGRLSRPLFPGETLKLCAWRDADSVLFEASVPARQTRVFAAGRARLEDAE